MLGALLLYLTRDSGLAPVPQTPALPYVAGGTQPGLVTGRALINGGGRAIPIVLPAVRTVGIPTESGVNPLQINRQRGGVMPATPGQQSTPRSRGPSGLGATQTVISARVKPRVTPAAPQAGPAPPLPTSFYGTAFQQVGQLQQSATGTELEDGTAAQQVGQVLQAGTGSELEDGSAAQLVGRVQQSAAGYELVDGSAAQQVGQVLQSATGTSGPAAHNATAAQTVGRPVQEAFGFGLAPTAAVPIATLMHQSGANAYRVVSPRATFAAPRAPAPPPPAPVRAPPGWMVAIKTQRAPAPPPRAAAPAAAPPAAWQVAIRSKKK